MRKVIPQIGLTGCYAGGKSQVSRLFEAWGSVIVDCDLIARELLTTDGPVLKSVVAAFGASILAANGSIDRSVLRQQVFDDAARKALLEDILHPAIRTELKGRSAAIAVGTARLKSITFVIPLLFESSYKYDFLSCTVAVLAARQTCILRAQARDHIEANLASRIFDSQLDPALKAQRADYVIENNGSLADLKQAARVVFDRIHSGSGECGSSECGTGE